MGERADGGGLAMRTGASMLGRLAALMRAGRLGGWVDRSGRGGEQADGGGRCRTDRPKGKLSN